MRDEMVIEELAVRAIQERMDEAFRTAMQRAVEAGQENTPTVISKKARHQVSEGRVRCLKIGKLLHNRPRPQLECQDWRQIRRSPPSRRDTSSRYPDPNSISQNRLLTRLLISSQLTGVN